MAKTLYHSELAKAGPVKITIKTKVLQSKYSTPAAPKPPYVSIILNGEERNYNCENDSIAAWFDQRKTGETISVCAEGQREEATITLVGQAIGEPQEQPRQPAAPRPAPAPSAPRPPASAPVAPPAESKQNRARTPMGPTVGMAINNACASITAQGRVLNPQEVYEIASDLLRISYHLEDGHLAPKHKDGQHPQPK